MQKQLINPKQIQDLDKLIALIDKASELASHLTEHGDTDDLKSEAGGWEMTLDMLVLDVAHLVDEAREEAAR